MPKKSSSVKTLVIEPSSKSKSSSVKNKPASKCSAKNVDLILGLIIKKYPDVLTMIPEVEKHLPSQSEYQSIKKAFHPEEFYGKTVSSLIRKDNPDIKTVDLRRKLKIDMKNYLILKNNLLLMNQRIR